MKKLFHISVVVLFLIMGVVSCKSSSCGCGSYGKNNIDNQVEELA
jgi:hypothetical protein